MRILFVLAVVIPCLVVNFASAQNRRAPRPAAFTDAAEAGADFALQGEYAGWAFAPGRGYQYVGLQVVALGEGKFDAVAYRGGLPGNGWDRVTKKKLSGQIEDGKLVLIGPEDRMVVSNATAAAVDDSGRELWRLTKVERRSPTLGQAPPRGAVVLFNGGPTDQFDPAAKISPEGLLIPEAKTKMPVGAFHLHLEFRTPFMPTARDQARGNSGVYVQRRYEVQILDSFGLEGAFNECGSLYRQTPPDLNMALPPLSWQTYDIWFTPPSFDADDKTKLANARITVLHNGVPVHWHREITAKTGGGQQEAATLLPIVLQDHGNPVMFRNIWIVPGEGDYYWQSAGTSTGYQQACCHRGWLRFGHRRRCG
jgi:hypothetical protein